MITDTEYLNSLMNSPEGSTLVMKSDKTHKNMDMNLCQSADKYLELEDEH